MICKAAVPVFIFISKGMGFAIAVRWPPRKVLHRKGDVGSLDGSRPVFYISPGIFEGALGLSQDNRAAPFDHRKVPVRFSVDNGIQNRAETVRLSPGSPTVHLRAFYGLSTACLQSYGLMKTSGKLGAACSAQRRPHDWWRAP